jgi:hypothetical protein
MTRPGNRQAGTLYKATLIHSALRLHCTIEGPFEVGERSKAGRGVFVLVVLGVVLESLIFEVGRGKAGRA